MENCSVQQQKKPLGSLKLLLVIFVQKLDRNTEFLGNDKKINNLGIFKSSTIHISANYLQQVLECSLLNPDRRASNTRRITKSFLLLFNQDKPWGYSVIAPWTNQYFLTQQKVPPPPTSLCLYIYVNIFGKKEIFPFISR